MYDYFWCGDNSLDFNPYDAYIVNHTIGVYSNYMISPSLHLGTYVHLIVMNCLTHSITLVIAYDTSILFSERERSF